MHMLTNGFPLTGMMHLPLCIPSFSSFNYAPHYAFMMSWKAGSVGCIKYWT